MTFGRFFAYATMTLTLSAAAGLTASPVVAQTAAGTPPVAASAPPETGYDPATNPAPLSPQELDLLDVGLVKEVQKSGTIILENGQGYALDQVRVPLALQAAVFERLNKRLAGTKVGLYGYKNLKFGKDDRYGNPYAHVVTENGEWLQADMVSSGLAWVDSDEFRPFMSTALYTLEDTAIARNIGFWQSPKYAVKTPDTIGDYSNSYQVYEGDSTGVRFERETGDYYVNMDDGAVTLLIEKKYLQDMTERKKTSFGDIPRSYGKKRLRIHGWVEKGANGKLSIKITHPEQIIVVSKRL